MLALKFKGKGKAIIEDIPIPKPEAGEVLLKIKTSALCGSERGEYLKGEESLSISGHEFTGEVVETNGARLLKQGDRVTVNVTQGCGICYYCGTGHPQFCSFILYWSGGHAEYARIPESCCIKLPDDISYDLGVLLGGDTSGVAYRAVSKLTYKPGSVVLVTGGGPIGLGVILFLKFFGYYVVVSEPSEYRRNFARDKAGADLVLNPLKDDIVAVLSDITSGLGPDAVIECSGVGKVQVQALEMVRCQGTVIFAGENKNEIGICPSDLVIHREITLTGAFYFTLKDFYEIIGLHRRGLKVEQLVSHRMELKDAPEAFNLFFSGESGKVLLYR